LRKEKEAKVVKQAANFVPAKKKDMGVEHGIRKEKRMSAACPGKVPFQIRSMIIKKKTPKAPTQAVSPDIIRP